MESRAWCTFNVKSVDPAQRIIEGLASTPDIDRGGDSMDPAGAVFDLPMAFLWFHNAHDPIGQVIDARVQPDGIFIKARVSHVSVPGRLKTLVDEAWAAFTADPPLVRGLSIGWKPLETAPIPGTRFQRVKRWIWGELSAVSIPMNTHATILAVKSADTSVAAASGTRPRVPSTPGVTGLPSGPIMTISEQVTTERGNLQTKSARLEQLMNDDTTNGGLEAADETERQGLVTEIKALTTKLEYLQTLEAAQAQQARTIFPAVASARSTPAPVRVEVKEYPKGTLFTRYAMAVAAGRGSLSDTIAYAKRWTDTPEVLDYIRKAVEGTSVVASPGWGGELVQQNTLATEFVELLRPMTIIGRVSGFRMTPFNIPIITQTGGSTFDWVGEGDEKPVSELDFSRTSLDKSKVAGIVVLTEELVRLSTPAAEETVRRDMVEQCARFLDAAFIQVGKASGANNPASISYGVSSPAASGTDAAALMGDLNDALATFDTADIPTDGLVIVMTPALARGISMLLNAIGQPSFPGMTPQGGTLIGYPVIVSGSVDSGTIVIFKPSEVLMADDGRVTLDASNQATLNMVTGSSPGVATFSLWQRNCVGIRAERWIRWQKRRSGVVAVIDTASYGPVTGSP